MRRHDWLACETQATRIARMFLDVAGIARPPPVFHVKDVKRGRWNERSKIITLPQWLWSDPHVNYGGFLEWYVSHELAHWLMDRPGHDLQFQFMGLFINPHSGHWESTYKPRLYAQARRLWDA